MVVLTDKMLWPELMGDEPYFEDADKMLWFPMTMVLLPMGDV